MLMAYVCHCGAMKDANKKFCDGCWAKLPAKVKAELVLDFDRGFEHAVQTLGWV
jgi:CDGSH-type Zn-finger protein